jgi:phage-related protein
MLPALMESVPQIIDTILKVITENLPLIIQMGVDTLVSLINGLVEALPKLIEYLPTIINTVVKILSDNLPKIIQAGITILVSLINGLTQALPQLIQMLPTIISTIVQVLIENLPLILKMGADILLELIKGIGSVLGSLGEQMLAVTGAILEAVADLPAEMLEVGGQIVSGIWEGISNGYDWIKKKIRGWVGDVTGFFKKALGIESPSKVMRDQIGQWLPSGIAEGFDEDMPDALKNMKKTMNNALGELKSDVAMQTDGMFGDINVGGSGSGISAGSTTPVVNFNQTINSPKAVDRLTIYRDTNSLLFSAKVRMGNV